jgi:hypothetical protein
MLYVFTRDMLTVYEFIFGMLLYARFPNDSDNTNYSECYFL